MWQAFPSNKPGPHQWRSQSSADARAHRGHKPRTQAPSSFQRLAVQKQLGGSGGCSPRIFELPRSILGLLYAIPSPWIGALRQRLCYKPTRAQRKVTVVLTANTYTSRSGEHTDLVILKIQIAKLRSSISTPISTNSRLSHIELVLIGPRISGGDNWP